MKSIEAMKLFKLGHYTDAFSVYRTDPDAVHPLKEYGEWKTEMAKVMVRQEENERAMRDHDEYMRRMA